MLITGLLLNSCSTSAVFLFSNRMINNPFLLLLHTNACLIRCIFLSRFLHSQIWLRFGRFWKTKPVAHYVQAVRCRSIRVKRGNWLTPVVMSGATRACSGTKSAPYATLPRNRISTMVSFKSSLDTHSTRHTSTIVKYPFWVHIYPNHNTTWRMSRHLIRFGVQTQFSHYLWSCPKSHW